MSTLTLIVILTSFTIIKAIPLIGDTIKEEFDQIQSKGYELIYFNNIHSFVDGNLTNILEFDAYNQHYKLELTLNDNYPFEIHHPQRSPQLPSVSAHKPCHYKGRVIEPSHPTMQWASISFCNGRGVRAFIKLHDGELVIHPAQYYLDPYNNPSNGHQIHHQHLIYKNRAIFATERLDTRRRLPYNDENVIELYMLVDPVYIGRWKDKYGSSKWYDEMVDYIQDFVNAASGEYENANWGYDSGTFSIKWVRLDVVESFSGDYRDLKYDIERDSYDGKDGGSGFRRKFRAWAQDNVDQDSYDFGAVYTHSEDGGGAAWKSGICGSNNYMHSCSNGGAERQRKLLAHELGHCLGMEHDEWSECCGSSDEEDGICDEKCEYTCPDGDVMGDGDENSGFSSCSKKYLRDYMKKRDGFKCLKKQSNSFWSSYGDNYNPGNDDDDDGGNNNYDNYDNNNDNGYNNYDNGYDNKDNEGCVGIRSLYMDGRRLDGEWYETDDKYGGKASYKLKNKDLYLYRADDDGWYWTISDRNGKEDWDYGWCDKDDVFDCDERWEGYDESDDDCSFSSCSELTLEGAVDECLTNNGYGDSLRVYYDGVEAEEVIYKVEKERGCSHNQPIYRYNNSYLHYNKYDSWVISQDNVLPFGSRMCSKYDVLQCVEGNWQVEVSHSDADEMRTHPTMTVRSYTNDSDDDDDVDLILILVILSMSVAFILLIIGVICMFKKRKKSKRDTKMIAVFDDDEEENEESEVDVTIMADAQTNTIIQ